VTDWQEQGLCRSDVELFTRVETQQDAIHTCRRHCPVLRDCELWARGQPWVSVVVGGVAYGQYGMPLVLLERGAHEHTLHCRAFARALEEVK
jgi:hypothetical protein